MRRARANVVVGSKCSDKVCHVVRLRVGAETPCQQPAESVAHRMHSSSMGYRNGCVRAPLEVVVPQYHMDTATDKDPHSGAP